MSRRDRLLLLAWVVAVGCGGGGNGDGKGDGDSPPEPEPPDDVIVPETTNVLTSGDLQYLSNAAPDLAYLEFSGADTLPSVDAEDVIVADVFPPQLPYGLLRRVTAVERSGGKLVLHTEQASLADAIERGTLDEEFVLDPDAVVRQGGWDTRDNHIGFVFALNDVALYDADGDASTTADRVSLDGNFAFRPMLKLEIDIDGFVLQKLLFEIGSEQQASIRITAGREASFDEQRVLEEIELAPITFSIGPVPVVLIPRILLLVGVDGTVTAELTAGVQADSTVGIGFGYQNGSWSPTSDLDADATFDVPAFREGAKGSARAWAGPRVELAAYGVAGVYGQLRGFVRGDVDVMANPWWTLSAGVDASAGAFLRVLDTTVADYETDPVTVEIQLADAGGPAPAGQVDVLTWARSFAGDNTDSPIQVLPTRDGGSLVVGSSSSFSQAPVDAWVLKLDALGQISWQRVYEDVGTALAVVDHPDGGYLLVTGAVGTGADELALVRIDDNGDVLGADQLTSAVGGLTASGLVARKDDFVVAGAVGTGSGADFWIASVDRDGTLRWSRAVGGDQGEFVNGFAVGDDGSIVAAGDTHSFGVSFNGQWVVKLDADGGVVWQAAYDGPGNELATAVVQGDDGGYRIVGHTLGDALVTDLGPGGDIRGATLYDAGTPYEEAYHALGTDDGGLIIAGKHGLGNDADVWLLRLTPDYEVLWTTAYGGPMRDVAGGTIQYAQVSRSLAATDDAGYLLIANSNSFGDDFSDIWVGKVSDTGTIDFDPGSSTDRTSLPGSFESYPISRAPTNAPPYEVSVTREPIEVDTLTPAPVVKTQGSPPDP